MIPLIALASLGSTLQLNTVPLLYLYAGPDWAAAQSYMGFFPLLRMISWW